MKGELELLVESYLKLAEATSSCHRLTARSIDASSTGAHVLHSGGHLKGLIRPLEAPYKAL